MELRKIFLFLLVCQLNAPSFSTKNVTGFYVENEFNQTESVPFEGKNDEKIIQEGMLIALGIDKIPQISEILSRDNNTHSAFKFLDVVYKVRFANSAVTFIDPTSQMELYDIANSDLRYVLKHCDFIMTSTAQNDKILGMENENARKLWFNVSEISAQDEIIDVEFKFYRNITNLAHKFKGPITVDIYENTSDEDLVFVDSTVVESQTRWVSVYVLESVTDWVKDPSKNRGFHLKVFAHNNPDVELKPDQVGIMGFKDKPEKRPFLVSYLEKNSVKRKFPEYPDFHGVQVPLKESIPCGKQRLYVNFEDYDWHTWLIVPSGYNADFCSGECEFYTSLSHRDRRRDPCCTPDKLLPLLILYRPDDGTYVLKSQQQMSVDTCACA